MLDMKDHERRAVYASLWVLALAFDWIEGSVVLYLREIYVREISLQGSNYFAGLQVSLVSLPRRSRDCASGSFSWVARTSLNSPMGSFISRSRVATIGSARAEP